MQLDFLIDSQPPPLHSLRKREGMIQMSDFKQYARRFSSFASAVELASKHLESRVTIQQLLLLARVLEAEAMGQSVTVADIRERDNLGSSLGRSYQIFTAPSKQFPDALDWLVIEEDADDRRRKTLKLTPAGRKIAEEFARRLS